MSICSISDIHVLSQNDDNYVYLDRFLKHPKVLAAQHIFFLGDIFELVCGPHEAYLKSFPDFFLAVKKMLKSGQKIYFFEGNHDVHVEKLFERAIGFDVNNHVQVFKHPLILNIDGLSFYFSHGDELDYENSSYLFYRKLISTKFANWLANKIIPHSIIEFLGQPAALRSRKRRVGYSEEVREDLRSRYREGAQLVNKPVDIMICGHTHIEDFAELTSGVQYLNNGYVPNTNKFVLVDQSGARFESLN